MMETAQGWVDAVAFAPLGRPDQKARTALWLTNVSQRD
jgi:hypothetical protein